MAYQKNIEKMEESLEHFLALVNIDEIRKATCSLGLKMDDHDAIWTTIKHQVVEG